MEKRKFTRRQLIATASAGTLGVMTDWHLGQFNISGKIPASLLSLAVILSVLQNGLNGRSGTPKPKQRLLRCFAAADGGGAEVNM